MTGLDGDLQRWVVEHRLGPLDAVFVTLSLIGSFGAVWIAIALVLAVTRRQPGLLALVTAGVLSADMLALGLKLAFARDRPYIAHPDPEPLLRAPLDLSFPSGHAATAFAGATILAAFAPRLAPWLLALAALVAWSRVYVGVHYPFDIGVGALLGTAVGLVLVSAVRWRRARAYSP